jgi:hypothetical protein
VIRVDEKKTDLISLQQVAPVREKGNGIFQCRLSDGSLKDLAVPRSHPAAQLFIETENILQDICGVERVIDSRTVDGAEEFQCVFDDERTEWLPVPQDHLLLQSFDKHKLRLGPLLEQKGAFVFEKMSDFVAHDWGDEKGVTLNTN